MDVRFKCLLFKGNLLKVCRVSGVSRVFSVYGIKK